MIEHHGRVEDITLYNMEPSEDDLAALKKYKEEMAKPAVVEEDDDDDSKKNKYDDDEKKEEKDKKKPKVVVPEKPAITCYDNNSAYLYEIFPDTQGCKKKKESEEPDMIKTVYYNFNPHDKNDPILLALFTTKVKLDDE